jgi:hypothetical protein
MSRGPAAPADAVQPKCGCDVDAFTLRARTKLNTLSVFLSQMNLSADLDDDIMHGLAWMLDDIRADLEQKGGA